MFFGELEEAGVPRKEKKKTLLRKAGAEVHTRNVRTLSNNVARLAKNASVSKYWVRFERLL